MKKFISLLLGAVLAVLTLPCQSFAEEDQNEDFLTWMESELPLESEAEESAVLLNEEASMLDRFCAYIEKNGVLSADETYRYLYDTSSADGEIIAAYYPSTKKLTLLYGKNTTDSAGKPLRKACTISYNTETLENEHLACMYKDSTSPSDLYSTYYNLHFDIKTYTPQDVLSFRTQTFDAVSDTLNSNLNATIRETVQNLDLYLYKTASATKVLSLDEIGFFGIVNPQLNNVKAFVNRLYELCLNREADRGGFVTWVTQLFDKKISAATAVQGFFCSKEMQQLNLPDDEFVERCYKVMMDRGSDAGGKKNWVTHLTNGVSRTYVLRGFVGSVEFTNVCNRFGIERGSLNVGEWRDQNYGATCFVSRLYTKALGRNYEVNGLNYWCEVILSKKMTAKEVAMNGFFHSAEFANRKLNDHDFVVTLYRTFMDREPDIGGLNDWVNRLSQGTSRDSVIAGFADSQEFYNILKKYKLV